MIVSSINDRNYFCGVSLLISLGGKCLSRYKIQNFVFPKNFRKNHSWRRFPNPLHYLAPFSKFFSNPPPRSCFCRLISLAERVIVPHVILLNDMTGLHLLSLNTLVPESPCCILCNKASSLL